jgi:hypothetical protein
MRILKKRGDEGILAKCILMSFRKKEATRGFEPLMRILQTLALPLGHVA